MLTLVGPKMLELSQYFYLGAHPAIYSTSQ